MITLKEIYEIAIQTGTYESKWDKPLRSRARQFFLMWGITIVLAIITAVTLIGAP